MAIFNILTKLNWNTYDDLAGGTVLHHGPLLYDYTSATGFHVILHGTGFTFDANGIPTGGTITGINVFKDGAHRAEYVGLTCHLTDYSTYGFGQTSGIPGTVPPDMDALYAILRVGDDVIIGSDFGRTYWGYDGNDRFYGGNRNDWFSGGSGVDTYFGGGGRNGLFFSDDTTAIHGVSIDFNRTSGNIQDDGFGNVETATNVYMAEGGSLADHFIANKFFGYSFTGHGGNDSMTGGNSSDTFDGGSGLDVIDGGKGQDQLSFFDVTLSNHFVIVDLSATTSPQVLNDGFGNAETLIGIEDISGSVKSDRLTGNNAGNSLWGQDGNDTMVGNFGNDGLYGGDGNDRVYGGNGDDQFEGDKGKDTYDGGFGTDLVGFWDVDKTGHGVVVDLNKARNNILDDGYGNAETAASIENLDGSDKGDAFTGDTRSNVLWGERGNDRLFGGNGNDGLYGGYDNDRIDGGGGADTLIGGFGFDTVKGGEGIDVFAFSDLGFPGYPGDHVVDYQVGVDRIVLNSSSISIGGDAVLLPAGFLAGAGRTEAVTASQIVIYDTTTGNLYFDSDGAGGQASSLIATFDNHANLTYEMVSLIQF